MPVEEKTADQMLAEIIKDRLPLEWLTYLVHGETKCDNEILIESPMNQYKQWRVRVPFPYDSCAIESTSRGKVSLLKTERTPYEIRQRCVKFFEDETGEKVPEADIKIEIKKAPVPKSLQKKAVK